MNNSKELDASMWKFEQGVYEWCEWWRGTKTQLQATGIGLGAAFPGEPGVAKSVDVVDLRGLRVKIDSKDRSLPCGVFFATCRFIEDKEDDAYLYEDDGCLQPFDGVTLRRCLYGCNIYRGTAEALVAGGLIVDEKLPGRPGRGKLQCTYRLECMNGEMVVNRMGKNRYQIRMSVAEDEVVRREILLRQRQLDRDAARLAVRRSREKLTGPQLRPVELQPRRAIPAGWRIITNANPPMRDATFRLPV
ncbi:hypothetical protein [Rhodoferax sp. GW822-FHT02A01]|uniref:hypothetical protein n=1 Tax=Rhodoferax sp. GW822-FHT02A01 TaxID=3141537 RepID=UPI00315C5D80